MLKASTILSRVISVDFSKTPLPVGGQINLGIQFGSNVWVSVFQTFVDTSIINVGLSGFSLLNFFFNPTGYSLGSPLVTWPVNAPFAFPNFFGDTTNIGMNTGPVSHPTQYNILMLLNAFGDDIIGGRISIIFQFFDYQ